MFDNETATQLRGIIREEVQGRFDNIECRLNGLDSRMDRLELRLEQKIEREIDALRTDMKSEFVAQYRRIVGEVGEMIEQNILPHVFRRA